MAPGRPATIPHGPGRGTGRHFPTHRDGPALSTQNILSKTLITSLLAFALAGCSSLPFFGGDDEADVEVEDTSEQEL